MPKKCTFKWVPRQLALPECRRMCTASKLGPRKSPRLYCAFTKARAPHAASWLGRQSESTAGARVEGRASRARRPLSARLRCVISLLTPRASRWGRSERYVGQPTRGCWLEGCVATLASTSHWQLDAKDGALIKSVAPRKFAVVVVERPIKSRALRARLRVHVRGCNTCLWG